MAAPGGKYFIQHKLKEIAPHHESYEALWETKWKPVANMGVYPFMFGTAKDFEPVVSELITQGFKEPYDWEAYAKMYIPQAEKLKSIAVDAENKGEKEKASEYYLRASAVYRIARFPALTRSPTQKEAWKLGKECCLKGLESRQYPAHEVQVPHTHRIEGEGDAIPVYHLVPEGATKEKPVPLVIIFSGLDGHRTELAVWMEGWRQIGVATAVLEIPGTGDCPAKADDPTSPDRLYDSLFEWIGKQQGIDQQKVVVWGFSTGGYYAIRIAHTHHDKLAGSVCLGGGCHHMFDAEWLSEVNHLEFPFDLADALALKYGYSDLETFKKEASKFSLLNDGTLDKTDCTRLLLVNGTEDEIFPIDDYWLAIQHGAPKEARLVPGKLHMGEPESFIIILNWLYKLLGIKADPWKQLSQMPFKPKY